MPAAAAPAPTPPPLVEVRDHTAAARRIQASVEHVLRGKPGAVRLAITALLARGHVLIEDIPGVGKTTLARALAASLGGTFRRIQFTSDLLPSDITGVTVFDQHKGVFELRKGPLFANVVLADEINRTTPRTQSALLEAMSEGHVSIDDATHVLDQPFVVLATQNPAEHFGTYPLPESQMDRFLLRLHIGYPDRGVEKEILRDRTGGDPVAALQPVIEHDALRAAQDAVEHVRVDDALLDYAMAVIEETRRNPLIAVGVSTRGALAWYRAAQAAALIDGRAFCVPDDLKGLAVPVLAHRLILAAAHESLGRARVEAERAIAEVVARVPVPT
ncbi:MAG: AAA family ATPase [Kofleriaceae bacterium]|nr:AAA family ATPase [Myxococcales bacterium]MCB9560906.1 AAA family ATPase [Kofleriaceae bacterium]